MMEEWMGNFFNKSNKNYRKQHVHSKMFIINVLPTNKHKNTVQNPTEFYFMKVLQQRIWLHFRRNGNILTMIKNVGVMHITKCKFIGKYWVSALLSCLCHPDILNANKMQKILWINENVCFSNGTTNCTWCICIHVESIFHAHRSCEFGAMVTKYHTMSSLSVDVRRIRKAKTKIN